MKALSKILIAGSLSLCAVAPAFAHQGHDRPFKGDNLLERMERQQNRIDRGVMNYQLTRKEAKQLRRQQRKIRYLAWRFYGDGHLSKKERRRLQRELDKSSRKIKRLKHNDLERYVNLHHRYGNRDQAHKL